MAKFSSNHLALAAAVLVLAGAFLAGLQSNGYATSLSSASITGCKLTNGGVEVCDGVDNNCDRRIDEGVKNCVTSPTLPKQELVVKKAGDGRGIVASTSSGINCGTVCGASYNQGTVVTLVATPSEDSIFGGWSGACSTTAPTCTITLNSQQTATAVFNLRGPTLIIQKSGTGSGTIISHPAGIDCGSTCAYTYAPGITSIDLIVTPASNSVFAGWNPVPIDCTTSASRTCTLYFSSAASQTLAARFTRSQNSGTSGGITTTTLTVTKAGAGLGTVISTSGMDTLRVDRQINSGMRCTTTYALGAGASVGLIATPAVGSTFGGWQGDCRLAGEDHSICIPNNMNGGSKTFVATFLPTS